MPPICDIAQPKKVVLLTIVAATRLVHKSSSLPMRQSFVFRRHHPVLHQLSTAERLVSCVFQPQITSRSARQASCRCGGQLYNNNNSIAAPKRHHNSRTYVSTMKRKPQHLEDQTRAKRSRPVVPEYHLTPSVRNDDGEIVWPAPVSQIRRAREIISEW